MSLNSGRFVYSTINLNDPEPLANRTATILGWVITFLIISWICVLLRFYVRFRVVRAPGWDDLCVGLYLTFYVENATYCSSAAFIKLALLLQYLRIFDRGTSMYKITLGVTIFTALWGIAYSVIAWVPCVPVSDYWDLYSDGKRCYGYGSHTPYSFVATYESHSAFNMALDTIVFIIPIPLLFKDGVTTAARLRLVALLSMGCIVLALAAWRLQTMIANQVATYPTRDPTWYGPISIILAALELNAASICASVPIFWPVFTQNWSGIFVTQEVKITRESRYNEEDRDSLTRGSYHSRVGSDTELSIVESTSGKKNQHYRDSYILRQVDPLRMPDDRDQPSARAGDPKDQSRKWTKF
ncbi:hypothetical protein JX265_004513 [Neoarthrinium moseri]|uniref:Rhodopsin domain-containing protein n=1 Tax=Neoarthrinium moseri TaxID=1658444 RepID=A0A9Q0ANT7_9PEZI|nr:hypothetical protein JX265_004513 [Neoarthrinium moseri]